LAEKQKREKVTTPSVYTSVLVSHLRKDRFVEQTDSFLRRAMENKVRHVIPEVVNAELYTGIFMATDPGSEEGKVQSFLAINGIEVKNFEIFENC
jgi:hypothetical protein